MKRFAFALALALASAAPVQPLLAQHVLNLRDADVRAFIQDAARVTGRTMVIDPAVQGRVTVVTDRPLSRSEYFELFLSTLRANGFVAVPIRGGGLRIQPVANAARTAPAPGRRSRNANAFVTEILRVRNIEAPAAAETLRPLVSQEGSITASRNSIVVVDYADNIRRIRQVLAQIDVTVDRSATRVLALENAGAREIAAALRELVPEGMTVVPIDSANAIALRGDAATVARMIEVAQDLDRRSASATEIRVIFLEHADAEQLLPVLQQLLGQSSAPPAVPAPTDAAAAPRRARGTNLIPTPAPTAAPPPAAAAPAPAAGPGTGAFGNQNAVVTRFEGANAIVIAASADVQRMLGEVIRQLDVRREQVLVEAIIVEISETAARQLGVQLLLSGLQGSNIPFAVTNYSNATPSISTIAGAIAAERLRDANGNSAVADSLQEAALNSVLGATGGIGGVAFRAGNAIFGAIINAVRSDSDSNILSTPSTVTVDNQEARILVGQEIPITTGEALSPNFDNAFRTVQRQNVGVTLEVTPQINAGGAIRLDLRVEVSSIAGPVTRNSSDLILNKRESVNTIVIDDGEIAAIGGLIEDSERRTVERIPILGDIPIIGNLFRSRSRSRGRTNLMIFIRPTIIRSRSDARAIAARRYQYIRGQQLLGNPNAEPSIDELLREYMGTLPPGTPQEPQPRDQVVTPAPAPPNGGRP